MQFSFLFFYENVIKLSTYWYIGSTSSMNRFKITAEQKETWEDAKKTNMR